MPASWIRYRLIGFNHGRVEHNPTSIHRALVFLSPSLGSQSAVAYQQRDFMSHCALHVETVCLQLPTSPSRSGRVDCCSVCRGPRGNEQPDSLPDSGVTCYDVQTPGGWRGLSRPSISKAPTYPKVLSYLIGANLEYQHLHVMRRRKAICIQYIIRIHDAQQPAYLPHC